MRFFRVLPLTIGTAVFFLIVKLVAVSHGSAVLSEAWLIGKVQAEQSGSEAPPKPDKHAEKKEGDKKEEKKEDDKKDAPKEGEKKEEAKPKEEHGEGGEEGEGKEKEKKNPAVSDTPGSVDGRYFSQAEIDLLQNLSRRREELDRWEHNVQIKEAALDATEKRINEKIQQIDDMKKAVADLLAQYNTQEETKLKSLVKIYESMKPDDAARIFDEIEMPVLLLVIDKMSEKKAAPILAKMDSKKAKQITVELAEQRRLNTTKLNSTAAALPPAAAGK